MADVNLSDGFNKQRSILGEITNLPTKRGFPEMEQLGIKRSKLNETEAVKKILVKPTQCPDINPFKGDLFKSSTEVRVAKVSDSSIAGETESRDDYFLIGENATMESSNVCNGNKAAEISKSGQRTAVLQSVDESDVGNGLMDCCGEIGIAEGDDLNTDKIDSLGFKSPNLTDLEGGRAENSVATEIDGVKIFDSAEGNDVSTVAEVGSEMRMHCGGVALGTLNISEEKPDRSSIDPPREDAFELVKVETSDEVGDDFHTDTSRTVSETGGNGLCGGDESKITSGYIFGYQNDGDEHNADNFVLSQSGSFDCMILPDSQESRVFGVEGSSELKKGDECAYIRDGIHSIKACSCSFCTKAGYIWLDLNYQDMKARISAMKRSQKEASSLARRSTRKNTLEKSIFESFTRPSVSNLECNLMYQWRSLFKNVEDLLEEESNHLEARLLQLTDLREKFKADLELINAASNDKHPGYAGGPLNIGIECAAKL